MYIHGVLLSDDACVAVLGVIWHRADQNRDPRGRVGAVRELHPVERPFLHLMSKITRERVLITAGTEPSPHVLGGMSSTAQVGDG